MVDNDWVALTLKFGGYWSKVKNENRNKYERGRQKTIKINKDIICFPLLIQNREVVHAHS